MFLPLPKGSFCKKNSVKGIIYCFLVVLSHAPLLVFVLLFVVFVLVVVNVFVVSVCCLLSIVCCLLSVVSCCLLLVEQHTYYIAQVY
mgnify:CR=1